MESTPQTKKQQKHKRAGKGVRAIIKNQEKNKIVKSNINKKN